MSEAKSKERGLVQWLAGLKLYFTPQMLVVLALGFSAGLPLFLTGSTLNIWMREEGVSLTTIGLFSLVGMPYLLKPLWAPVIDAVKLPLLYRRFGRRRSWLLTTQALLMAAIFAMGRIDPVAAPLLMVAVALAVTFASATQDIVIDAFRIEYLPEDQYAAGMANYVAAYRIAMLVSMSGSLYIVSMMQEGGMEVGTSWGFAYGTMATLVLVGVAAVLCAREPEETVRTVASDASVVDHFVHVVIHPFTDFMKKPFWAALLAFILFFKLGDALAGTMTAAFVVDIGFARNDYASVVGLYGLIATLIGGFAGGYVQRVAPLLRTLWVAGLLQMFSNLAYVWLAFVGKDMSTLVMAVTIENVTGGFGTVVFVAYLSGLCVNRDFTATQYALLTAFASVGRVLVSASGGWVVDHSTWAVFFLITTFAAIPGLGFLWFMQKKGILTEA
jgi:MFS transporter, PAT family, beta-lactamase induction signal transducer AmpG